VKELSTGGSANTTKWKSTALDLLSHRAAWTANMVDGAPCGYGTANAISVSVLPLVHGSYFIAGHDKACGGARKRGRKPQNELYVDSRTSEE
jgi:hypothetical protein